MPCARQPILTTLAFAVYALSSCGGSGGSGGGGTAPTIKTLSPTNLMVNVPLGTLLVSRSNFNVDALVQIDGQAVSTDIEDPHTLEAEISPSFDSTIATHQITVKESAGTSNAVSLSGDGHIDIAAGLMLAQQAVILFNNGNGQFSQSFFSSGADTISISGADLNHRGKTDPMFTNFGLDYRPPNVDVVFRK